jgi:hypothetical protein
MWYSNSCAHAKVFEIFGSRPAKLRKWISIAPLQKRATRSSQISGSDTKLGTTKLYTTDTDTTKQQWRATVTITRIILPTELRVVQMEGALCREKLQVVLLVER